MVMMLSSVHSQDGAAGGASRPAGSPASKRPGCCLPLSRRAAAQPAGDLLHNWRKRQGLRWSKNDPPPPPSVFPDPVPLPVCVQSFGYATTGDVEAWLGAGVRQPRESGNLLHLPPAELLQCISADFHQGRSDQIPHGSANEDKDASLVTEKSSRRGSVPLYLLVISLISMAAGQNDSPGESTLFNPRHQQLPELLSFGLNGNKDRGNEYHLWNKSTITTAIITHS